MRLIRLWFFLLRRRLLGPCPEEHHVAARLTVRFIDRVLAAIYIGDALEPLPWRRTTLADLRELLDARSAAVCLLRDLSLGRPAHPALVERLLNDEVVGGYLRERKLLV